MTLLRQVVDRLADLEVRFALIGAAALAVHGASRSTLDVDLLATDRRVLEAATWSPLSPERIQADIRLGDADDPLAGVVRFTAGEQRAVDLVVGKNRWQREAIDRAAPGTYLGLEIPVVRAEDLVLLKLFAGGPQDAWDVRQLLAGDERATLVEGVETHLPRLDRTARDLWRRILSELE